MVGRCPLSASSWCQWLDWPHKSGLYEPLSSEELRTALGHGVAFFTTTTPSPAFQHFSDSHKGGCCCCLLYAKQPP